MPSWSSINIVTGSAHTRKKPQAMSSRKGINNHAMYECVNSQKGKKIAMLAESKGMELPSGEKAVYQQAVDRFGDSITTHGRRKTLDICSYAIRLMTNYSPAGLFNSWKIFPTTLISHDIRQKKYDQVLATCSLNYFDISGKYSLLKRNQ